jgi:two-component system nitrogen regulation response regulator NtrX
VAEALHSQSRRRDRSLVKVNCAALPAELIEAELFGHAKGAFTDAKIAKAGLFEEADGGTLFLDEIGDMSYPLQARLLRVLEDGKVRRVGETKDRQVDVRVVAATHNDLEAAVRAGRFREDLYFRLAHLPLTIPPLRDRTGDVRLLFDQFLRHFARRHGLTVPRVAAEIFPHLERYPFPGNVRELRSLAERLLVFGGDPLTADHLPAHFFDTAASEPIDPPLLSPALPTLPFKDFKLRSEREYLERILQKNGWNLSATARKLDIQRTHLHQKVKDLGLRRPAGEEAEAEEQEGR